MRPTARRLLEAARIASSLGDPDLAAAAALANTRGFSSLIGDLDDDRVEAIERAVELDDRSDPGRRARLLALQSQELLYEHDRTRRQALATEAIALAGDIGDPRVKARVLQHVFYGLWGPDMLDIRASLANDLLASAQAAEDRALEFWANVLLMHVSFETVRFRAGTGRARAPCRSSRRLSLSPRSVWVAQVGGRRGCVLEGDLAAGERLARQACRARPAGRPARRAPDLRRAPCVPPASTRAAATSSSSS